MDPIRQEIRRALLEAIAKERIHGGLASQKTVDDIAEKHDVSIQSIKSQLRKGIGVEKEHTDDPNVAREIAMDHLMEDPTYYDKLEKMEEK